MVGQSKDQAGSTQRLRPADGTGLRDARPGLRDAKPALRDAKPGLRSSRPALRDSKPGLRDQIQSRRADATSRSLSSPASRGQERVVGSALRERQSLDSRLRDYTARGVGAAAASRPFGSPLRNDPVSRLKRPYVVYRDRPDYVRHVPHHVHTYYDRHHRIGHRIIWPRYHYPVYYSWGPRVVFRQVYPYYHRKYVFVSLGGYWPVGCSYVRYHWYGWHPYAWYGYYPIPREVECETHNYYTYNYYTADGDSGTSQVPYVDDATYAKVRERLQEQQAPPAEQTLADTRFEEGVKSFESGDYTTAAAKFEVAMGLAPEDMILPFAYAQALFASQQYSAAAGALREALKKVSPEEQGVFYPRGLYPGDDALFEQIEKLLDKLERFGYDGDLQLLLGYHLLGIGETEYARRPLEQASQDLQNAKAAQTLLTLLDKMEADTAAGSAGGASQASPGTSGPSPATRAGAAVVKPEGAAKSEVLRRLSENGGAAAEPKAQAGAPQAADTSEVGREAKPEAVEKETAPQTEPSDNSGAAPNSAEVGAAALVRVNEPQFANKEDDDVVHVPNPVAISLGR